MTARAGVTAIAIAALVLTSSLASAGSNPQTERASVSSEGAEAGASSSQPSLSSNGRYLAFVSSADDLVADDSNGAADVYVRNLKRGKTTRVSVGRKRVEADGASSEPTLSANGRYVAFVSHATNLAKTDKNDQGDVFVRDLKRGKTQRISLGRRGAEPNCGCFHPVISGNGKFVAFSSFATNLVRRDRNESADVFLRDIKKRKTTRLSVGPKGTEANGDSYQPSISASGRSVAFASDATNLAKGDDNGLADVYVREGRRTIRISRGLEGNEPDGDSLAPAISAKGKAVAFSSFADNLVEDDGNAVADVFLSDLKGAAKRASVASAGTEADDESFAPSLSGNGKSIAFYSYATNLVAADENEVRDVFVHSVRAATTERVSVSSSGVEGDAASFAPSISGNGSVVAFSSSASNLVDDDLNEVLDVFVR